MRGTLRTVVILLIWAAFLVPPVGDCSASSDLEALGSTTSLDHHDDQVSRSALLVFFLMRVLQKPNPTFVEKCPPLYLVRTTIHFTVRAHFNNMRSRASPSDLNFSLFPDGRPLRG